MSFNPSTVRAVPATRVRETTSRIERWIEEQNSMAPELYEHDLDGPLPMIGTPSHPYLAYPHMSVPSLIISEDRPISPTSGFSDQAVTPTQTTTRLPGAKIFGSARVVPSTPPSASLGANREGAPHTLGRGALPFRSIHLNFGSRRHLNSTSDAPTHVHIPSSTQDTASRHARDSSSLSSLFTSDTHIQLPKASATSAKLPSTWKFKRVSVMQTFNPQPGSPGSVDSYQPRPSTSSSTTPSSSTHTTPTRPSLDSHPSSKKFELYPISAVRSQAPSGSLKSGPSLWSLPMQASHINDPPESEQLVTDVPSRKNDSTVRILTIGKSSKKRKLIISGIPAGDDARFEAAKKWCESFGEINQIVRAPSGDLHVDFRKAEVADTVCRLQARVYITGVGSVGLSWFTGKKP